MNSVCCGGHRQPPLCSPDKFVRPGSEKSMNSQNGTFEPTTSARADRQAAGSDFVEEAVNRGVPRLLPFGEAIANHALAGIDVDRLGGTAFDCADLSRAPGQGPISELGDELPVGRSLRGLGAGRGLTSSPVAQARRTNQSAVRDAAFPGSDSGDGPIGGRPAPRVRRSAI